MNIHQYLRIVKFSYINWKDTDIVYGIYKNNKLLYIGKSSTFEVRKAKHLWGKYKDCDIRLMKIGKAKLHWERVYIEWNSLKYHLDNKIFNIREKKVTDKQKERLTDFYKIKWKKYKNPIILKYHLL